jgi:hypothetical protein
LAHLLELIRKKGNNILIQKQQKFEISLKNGKTRKLDLKLEDNLRPDYQAMFAVCSGSVHLKLVKKGYFGYTFEPYLAVLSTINFFLVDMAKFEVKCIICLHGCRIRNSKIKYLKKKNDRCLTFEFKISGNKYTVMFNSEKDK